MKKRWDGGPAFPCVWTNDSDMNNSAPDGAVVPPNGTRNLAGLTAREYYAAHAPEYPFQLPQICVTDKEDPVQRVANAIARWNFAFADAMLKVGAE